MQQVKTNSFGIYEIKLFYFELQNRLLIMFVTIDHIIITLTFDIDFNDLDYIKLKMNEKITCTFKIDFLFIVKLSI